MAHGDPNPDLRRVLEDPSFARAAADSIQALSAPSRLRILARLHAGPASVSDLAAAVDMESSAVSHQLRTLRHLGLVVGGVRYARRPTTRADGSGPGRCSRSSDSPDARSSVRSARATMIASSSRPATGMKSGTRSIDIAR